MSTLTVPLHIPGLDAELPASKAFNVIPRVARGLIDRMTFGFSTQELSLYQRRGHTGYVDYHLASTSIDDSVLDAYLATNYPVLTMTPQQLSQQTNTGDGANQLVRARLMRAVFSKRQFNERVVEMWTDHFNIYLRDDLIDFLKVADDRDVVRANALGSFPNMLRASAHSPAMLIYLNNDTNTRTAPNENYARELMELHSLGVDGGYTQQDVQQVAKCFTGWTYQPSSAGVNAYTFRYNNSTHDQTQKTVLGNIIPANGGQQDGETVLNILAAHPSTAKYIARKMLVAFWGYTPSQSLIDSVANVYTQTSGDIKSMLRYILLDASVPPRTPKFKRPMHLAASMLRGLNAEVTQPNNLQTPLVNAGHAPFEWIPPDGYPDNLSAWTGLLLARWNLGASLMNGSWFNNTTLQGIRVVQTNLLAGTPTTAAAIADRLNFLLTYGTMTTVDRDRVMSYMLPDPPNATRINEAIGLAVSSPSFQWH
jgi:uncharacterized protein (DUF1800 family)